MDWVKIIHLLAVIGWMTSVFAVPRALIYCKREWERIGEFGPLADLTFRLYRFSGDLGIIAIVFGFWLAFGQWGFPPWLHLKLLFVGILAAQYVRTGKMVADAKRGIFRYSDMFMRIYNEAGVIITLVILWAVVAKPF